MFLCLSGRLARGDQPLQAASGCKVPKDKVFSVSTLGSVQIVLGRCLNALQPRTRWQYLPTGPFGSIFLAFITASTDWAFESISNMGDARPLAPTSSEKFLQKHQLRRLYSCPCSLMPPLPRPRTSTIDIVCRKILE